MSFSSSKTLPSCGRTPEVSRSPLVHTSTAPDPDCLFALAPDWRCRIALLETLITLASAGKEGTKAALISCSTQIEETSVRFLRPSE